MTRLIQVYDTSTGEPLDVPIGEAAAGLMRFARSLGPGTPACGVWEQRALELLRSGPGASDIDQEPPR
jgi:hypothetical protein